MTAPSTPRSRRSWRPSGDSTGSADPAKALPFVALSTSPYGEGDCCTEGGHVYRSTMKNNVWAPSEYPQGWEDLGPVSDFQEGADE